MKNFFAAIIDGIVTAGLKVYDFFRTFHFRSLAADIRGSFMSLFSPSSAHDTMTTKKRIAIAVSVVVLILAVIAVKNLVPFGKAGAKTVELKNPTSRDGSGTKWSLSLMKGQSASRIAESGEDPGPPLLVKGEAQARGRIVTVGVTMEGQAGEKYVPGVMKDGKWQQPPGYQLVSEKGKVIGHGRFEYG